MVAGTGGFAVFLLYLWLRPAAQGGGAQPAESHWRTAPRWFRRYLIVVVVVALALSAGFIVAAITGHLIPVLVIGAVLAFVFWLSTRVALPRLREWERRGGSDHTQ